MSYDNNDPDQSMPNDPRRPRIPPRDNNVAYWAVGIVGALVALGLVLWAFSDNINLAGTNRPATPTTQTTGAAPPDPVERNATPPATTRTAPSATIPTTPPAKQQ